MMYRKEKQKQKKPQKQTPSLQVLKHVCFSMEKSQYLHFQVFQSPVLSVVFRRDSAVKCILFSWQIKTLFFFLANVYVKLFFQRAVCKQHERMRSV